MTKNNLLYRPLLPSSDHLQPRTLKRQKNFFFFLIILAILCYGIFSTNLHKNFHKKNLKLHAKRIQKNAIKLQENAIEHAANFQNKVIKFFETKNIIRLESGIELDDGLSEDAKRFIKELNLTNPGDKGEPVILDEKLLTDEHNKLIKKGWDAFGYNVFVSNLISLNRISSDFRSEECKKKIYSENLPKVSVVLHFYNEAFSVLMRTVHSILINTPEHLLEEIVLVDDNSENEELKEKLEESCKKLKKVKLIRTHTRLSIAGAKVTAFKNAKGPIIVSLDSHSEVPKNWLEPFLDRLKDNPTLAVYGEVKGIDAGSFAHKLENYRKLTAFNFDMSFNYPKMETYQPELNYWEPHRSPIFDGPNFAFWKEFGEKIGYIDTDFDMWGGDDLEFGLKHWLCGGSIEYVPCTGIMHMTRRHVYSAETKGKGGKTYNFDRIVESWFDDNYKKYYYRTVGDTKTRNYGDISKNLELKEKLKCKSFTWYVENVFTDLKIPREISDEVWLTTTTTTTTVKPTTEKQKPVVKKEENKNN